MHGAGMTVVQGIADHPCFGYGNLVPQRAECVDQASAKCVASGETGPFEQYR